ncbi:MAG: hypothetical protein H0U91_14605 [Rubrobacter sp.]|nr:hypothetical protein [Rubrobacter sp.]
MTDPQLVSGFREEGAAVSCEWRVGRGAATAEYPGPFVALVDLGPAGGPTGVWVVPSGKIRKHLVSSDKPRPHRYHAPGEELAPHADDWDSIEDHLLGKNEPQRAWFDREDLRDRYGDGFVGTLDVEAARLLGVQNSITLRMADERFPAEDLADASALLSVLFRRWMEAKRRPGRE